VVPGGEQVVVASHTKSLEGIGQAIGVERDRNGKAAPNLRTHVEVIRDAAPRDVPVLKGEWSGGASG
jgi:hypothetical protein